MAIDPKYFIHDDDRAALDALKSIPGFTALIKGFMKDWNENQFRILNMSSRVRLSETQLPTYYGMLGPICEKLGIEVPELYLEMNVVPNAYTYGDTKPFIVITSGLLDALPDHLIRTVLAHECGHIACHHTLYRTMGAIILGGTSIVPGIGTLISLPLRIAFAYWMRCSEFSADRAAVLCEGTSASVVELCMRLAGYTQRITDQASTEEFLKQALEYKALLKDNMWNQSLEFMILAGQSHPLTAVRAYEADAWGRSESTQALMTYLSERNQGISPKKIPVSGSAASFIGRNAAEVQQELSEAGFTSIQTERITSAENRQPGEICAFSIAGDSTFKELSWFTPDALISLTYYEPLSEAEEKQLHPNEVRMPESSDSYIGRPWKEVCQELVKAGFRNIVTVKTNASRPLFTREDGIRSITINGIDTFEQGTWFTPDSAIRVVHYGS